MNPCESVKVNGGQRAVKPGVAISRDDFDRLLTAVPSEKRLLLALSGYCGLRWGEAVNIAQRLLGHAQASTTLNRYTHHLSGGHDEVGRVFGD